MVKEYNDFGKLAFEGEYLNGERNGFGKEFDDSGILIFQGEYLKGKKWNSSNNNDSLYGLKDGKGLINEHFGSLNVECQYFGGEKNGKGEGYFDKNKVFEVEYKNGKKNGKGKEFFYDGGLSFDGEYYYDYKIRGREYYPNGKLEYEGEYFYDKKWNGKDMMKMVTLYMN